MRIRLFTLLVASILFACKNQEIHYQAAENDVADIRLVLQSDHSFVFHFQSMTDETDTKSYDWRGTWQEKEDRFYLIFSANPAVRPNLNALFENQSEEEHSVRIESAQQISFIAAPTITIWGVVCEKIENRRP